MRITDSQFYVYSRWGQGTRVHENEDFFVMDALYDFDQMPWQDWVEKYKQSSTYSFHKPEILGHALSDFKYHQDELPIADEIISDMVFDNGKGWRYDDLLVIISSSSDNASRYISDLRRQKSDLVNLSMPIWPIMRKNSWEEF